MRAAGKQESILVSVTSPWGSEIAMKAYLFTLGFLLLDHFLLLCLDSLDGFRSSNDSDLLGSVTREIVVDSESGQ